MSFYESYQQTVFFYPPTLTIPGVTDCYEVYVINYLSTRNYTLMVSVQDIDSSVIVRLEGSNDNTNYAAMISNTITDNGTYMYNIIGAPVKYVRANFLKETGGNNARVTFQISAN